MALNSGSKLGPYEIQSALGAGGMGEVYRARDIRLDRTVAIKILASHLSATPELKQRFEREARTISSLNHAHICQLFDVGSQDGTDYLVMEFLEGETLAERLRKGALPLNELLKIGMEIAEALEVAHRAGIIHRDLKPGNIMLTRSGAKLMDFGLAKPSAIGAAASGSAPLLSAARTASGPSPMSPLTTAGSIVGTIQYMSPEQIEGKEADARSDIFAFGAVLYEMATGKRAFEGKSQISVASAILEKDPDPISTTKPLTPPQFEHVVRRALEKLPDERWQTATDLRGELKWIAEGGSNIAPVPGLKSRRVQHYRVSVAAAILAAVIAIAATYAAYTQWQRARDAGHPLTAEIGLPPEEHFFAPVVVGAPAISPDGTTLAYFAGSDSGLKLYVRELATGKTKALDGADGAQYVFWSPDSQNVAFFLDGELERMRAAGGPVQAICAAHAGRGGSWSANGTIIFAPDIQGPLYRVSEAGGTPEKLTDPKPGWTNRNPYFLPDGEHFLFTSRETSGSAQVAEVDGASLKDPRPKLILQEGSNVQLSRGYLLYYKGGNLVAQKFDERALSVKGEPIPIAENLDYYNPRDSAAFAASPQGLLVYNRSSILPSQPVFVDEHGKASTPLGEAALYANPGTGAGNSLQFRSDKLALVRGDSTGNESDIWILDTKRNVTTRATFTNALIAGLAFSPDGSTVAYAATSGKNTYQQYLISTTSGENIATVSGSGLAFLALNDWSHDGRYLFGMLQKVGTGEGLFYIDLHGDKRLTTFLTTPGDRVSPTLSPDGKWLAYSSDESGKFEIYVTGFPGAQRKWQVSSQGGGYPYWSADGRELYFVQSNQLMEVPIHSGDSFDFGSPAQVLTLGNDVIAVTPGSTQNSFFELKTVGKAQSLPMRVVANWAENLNH